MTPQPTTKTPPNWRTVKLGDVAEVITGKTPPTKNKALFGGTYPFITPTDIDDSVRFCEASRFLSEQGKASQPKLLLPPQTVCYTCIASIGKVCITNQPSFSNQQINSLIVKKEFSYHLFLFYILKHLTLMIKNVAGGTTTGIINKTQFQNITLTLPPLPEQKAIAGVLGAFDDKIELLRAQNKTLEQIGQTLFEEWFGQYQVDDELPNGWHVGKIKDMVNFLSGFSFKSTDFHPNSAKYRLVTIKNVQDGYLEKSNMNYIDKTPVKMPKHCLLSKGDILLSLTGNVGRCCLVDVDNLLLNQRVSKLAPKKESYVVFIYILFRQSIMRKKLQDMSRGTAQANLSPIETAEMELVVPSQEILEKFSDITKPLFDKILLNTQQIQTLEKMRDALLPKLMSGEVRVKMK